MYSNYRRPFGKYWWLQKIYFGIYTTAQSNVICLDIRDLKVFWGWGGWDKWCVCDFTSRGSFSYTTAWNSVPDHSCKTPCPVLLSDHLTRPSESASSEVRQGAKGPGHEGEGAGQPQELGSDGVGRGCPTEGVQWIWCGWLIDLLFPTSLKQLK